MKASLCFLILALSQSIYCTPIIGLGALAGVAAGASGGGASDCGGDKGGAGDAGSGHHDGNGGGLPSLPNVNEVPGGSGPGAGLPSAPGGSFPCAQCADDDVDCSPITGLAFAQPSKVQPGGVGSIALTVPQLAILNKAKSELVHGGEAIIESASHADVDKSFQRVLNTIDKVVVRAGQLIDSFVPGAGCAAVQIYAQVSKAAHTVAKIETKLKVGLTGGEAGVLGGGFI